MKNTVLFLLTFFVGLFVWACEEEDPVSNDSTVSVIFYNIDSLLVVEEILNPLTERLSVVEDSLDYYSDAASIVLDSIFALELLILDGDETLQPIVDELNIERFRLDSIYAYYDTLDSSLYDTITHWTEVETAINNGEVVVASITNKNNGASITYDQETDTASIWQIPLDMNADTTSLELELDGEIFELSLSYSRFIETNDFGEVEVNVFGFTEDRITSTFDSLELDCETRECLDGEVSISVYF